MSAALANFLKNDLLQLILGKPKYGAAYHHKTSDNNRTNDTPRQSLSSTFYKFTVHRYISHQPRTELAHSPSSYSTGLAPHFKKFLQHCAGPQLINASIDIRTVVTGRLAKETRTTLNATTFGV